MAAEARRNVVARETTEDLTPATVSCLDQHFGGAECAEQDEQDGRAGAEKLSKAGGEGVEVFDAI